MEDVFFSNCIKHGILMSRFSEVLRISLIFLSSWLEVCRNSFNNSSNLTKMLDIFDLDRQFIIENHRILYDSDEDDDQENKEDDKNDKQKGQVQAHKRWLN